MAVHTWRILVLALVVEAAIVVAGQGDFVASDPLWYADIAHRLSVHPGDVFTNHETHPFLMRVGLTLPVALFYRLFGVSTLVSNLPSLIGALGVILVVYAAAPTPRAKLIGLGLCLTSTALVKNATILNVDLPSSALMACVVLALSRRHRPHGAAWLLVGTMAWVAAFLVKETALWCVIVWLYAIVVDVREDGRRALRSYVPALAVGGALAGAYLAACLMLWGNPWARFQGIQDLTYEHAWALPGKPATAWIHRLTWQPAWLMIKQFQATLIPAALAGWLVRGRERIWWVSTVGFALLYWFGSSSLSAYAPLPISPRMILPVLPGIIVCAAIAGDVALDCLRGSRIGVASTVVVAAAIVVPGLRSDVATALRHSPETSSFARLRDDVAAGGQVVLVCGEPRCTEIATFYFGFEVPTNVTVEVAGDFARSPRPDGAVVRALVNLTRAAGARRTDPKLDRTAQIDALQLPMLAGDRNVHLLDAGDGERLWSALQSYEQ